MPEPVSVSVHGPFEDLAIAIVQLIGKVIDGQPPEVRQKLWEMHIEDIKAWRAIWDKFKPKE